MPFVAHAMPIAVCVFGVVYGAIISEKVHKALVALLGAGLLIGIHVLPVDVAMRHIDVNVIFLLIFMMVIVGIAEKSGFFEWLTVVAAKQVKAEPRAILVALFCLTAVLSAFLDNVTTVLLVSPISILIAVQLGISPVPFLLTQIIASNVGGTATLIGDPPNIMIGSAAGLSFVDFLVNLATIVAIQVAVVAAIFYLLFRRSFKVSAMNRARIMEMDASRMIKDRMLLYKSLTVLGLVIAGFLLHGMLEVEASLVAMLGAGILGVWTRVDFDEVLHKVEWGTLLFFVGLFMLVGALDHVGFISVLARGIIRLSGGSMVVTSQAILWFTGILSGFVDNIPLTATFIPVIKEIGVAEGPDAIRPLWWSLSLGACLGGNLTAIGASANVVVLSIARKSGHPISFARYLAYGVPITFFTLGVSSLYLLLRY